MVGGEKPIRIFKLFYAAERWTRTRESKRVLLSAADVVSAVHAELVQLLLEVMKFSAPDSWWLLWLLVLRSSSRALEASKGCSRVMRVS